MPQECWYFYWKILKCDIKCVICDSSKCIGEAQLDCYHILCVFSGDPFRSTLSEGSKCCSKFINLRISNTDLLAKAKKYCSKKR